MNHVLKTTDLAKGEQRAPLNTTTFNSTSPQAILNIYRKEGQRSSPVRLATNVTPTSLQVENEQFCYSSNGCTLLYSPEL